MDGQCSKCGVSQMSAEELAKLVRDAIRAEFTACGLLASTPAEQIEAQSDFLFLRRWRKLYDTTVTKIGTVVVLFILGCVGSLITLGFNMKFGK